MTHMELHVKIKTGLWPECAETGNTFDNVMLNPHKEKYTHRKFDGKI